MYLKHHGTDEVNKYRKFRSEVGENILIFYTAKTIYTHYTWEGYYQFVSESH